MLCVRGIGSTFQQPAIQSIIPQLVPKDQLVKINGWMQLLNSGSFLIGPVIGASLYAIFPMSVVLMSDVITFYCSPFLLDMPTQFIVLA